MCSFRERPVGKGEKEGQRKGLVEGGSGTFEDLKDGQWVRGGGVLRS